MRPSRASPAPRTSTPRGWQLIGECTREALAAAGIAPTEVVAVTSTSMREGMVLYDAAGVELWACPNVDSRAGARGRGAGGEWPAHRFYDIAGDWVAITAPPPSRGCAGIGPTSWSDRAPGDALRLGAPATHRVGS